MTATRKRNNPHTAWVMQKAMQEAPQSYAMLAALTDLDKRAVAHWIKTLRAGEPMPVYIAEWAPDKNGRLFVAMYRWGQGTDAPRPGQRITPAERMRALRAARKAANDGK